jgi:hypothetical protein
MCKGTQQLVHRSCLDHWRSVKVKIVYALSAMFSAIFNPIQYIVGYYSTLTSTTTELMKPTAMLW